ncbi:HET-domain-containing protein [Microthyrium microscopicum]|uniref:HET-domain-containing protein n=1 Tax=Microthyrium microscopicum TaxID=703497 RepID=A0A6A6UHB5_9PEZI|nr:HET-domain-containing protein [Microthyrium microscopicum]
MPKISSRGPAFGRKRKAPAKQPTAGIRTSKRLQKEEMRVAALASASSTTNVSELQLCCSYCTRNGLGDISAYVIIESINRDELRHILHNMNNSACNSCELLGGAIRMTDLLPDREGIGSGDLNSFAPFKMTTYKGKLVISDSHKSYDSVLLDTNHGDNPITIPESIDFAAPIAWLEHCKRNHEKGCGQRDVALRHLTPIDVILVDVNRDCLTMSTTASTYFALSYVWGGTEIAKTTMNSQAAFRQPGSLKDGLTLPKTISDAMLLTKKMGVGYLWVDCLCVVQDSPNKHQEIGNMDIVYSQAELTIVAANGMDADSGLPGVRPKTRRETVASKIQGPYFLKRQMPVDKPSIFDQTTYSTRGWTFQELTLSKRVLLVTNNQLVFHCDTTRCSESQSGEESHRNGEVGAGIIDLRNKKSSTRSNISILQSYFAMVTEYCKKRLSYQADIENAFAGLASILQEWCGETPVIHGMLSSLFGHSMMWFFDTHQHLFSAYSLTERGKRRDGFPSWSWTGWIACYSNLNSDSNPELPVQSLIDNVEITIYSERYISSESLSIADKSFMREGAVGTGQQIQVNLEPTQYNSSVGCSSTLAFDGERTEWKNFAVKGTTAHNATFAFARSGKTLECGFLSVAPEAEICHEIYESATDPLSEADCGWSLVRLYHLRMAKEAQFEGLQFTFERIEKNSEGLESGFAERFQERLQATDLLFVLLIRRNGQHWERIGSGVMFQKDWPSTSKRAKVRAYRERIVLV